MCNINAIISNRAFKKDTQKVCAFMQSATSVSFIRNDDGDGFFTDKSLCEQSLTKLNFFDYKSRIKNSKFIVSHQRFTTSGRAFINTQPIETNRYLLVHNGILYSQILSDYQKNYPRYTEKSDTFEYADLIEENNEKTTIEKIKSVFDGENGSYSCFLYDKIKDELYYFKNAKTSMYARLLKGNNKESMFFTTNKDNLIFMDFLPFNKKKTIKIRDNTIYRIYNEEKIGMVPEGKILNIKTTITKTHHVCDNVGKISKKEKKKKAVREYNYEESENNFKAAMGWCGGY